MLSKTHIFGFENEEKVLPRLRKYFLDDTIEKINERYSVFDFTGDKKYIELKSRTFPKSKYNTTIIGSNKLFEAKKLYNEGYDIYLCFSFTDGLYFWKYDPNVSVNTYQNNSYIPIDILMNM